MTEMEAQQYFMQNTTSILVVVGIFVAWWIAGFTIWHFLCKEMCEWVVGPEHFKILGICVIPFPPLGLYELWKARKMNREGTYPNAIVSVWFQKE